MGHGRVQRPGHPPGDPRGPRMLGCLGQAGDGEVAEVCVGWRDVRKDYTQPGMAWKLWAPTVVHTREVTLRIPNLPAEMYPCGTCRDSDVLHETPHVQSVRPIASSGCVELEHVAARARVHAAGGDGAQRRILMPSGVPGLGTWVLEDVDAFHARDCGSRCGWRSGRHHRRDRRCRRLRRGRRCRGTRCRGRC